MTAWVPPADAEASVNERGAGGDGSNVDDCFGVWIVDSSMPRNGVCLCGKVEMVLNRRASSSRTNSLSESDDHECLNDSGASTETSKKKGLFWKI